MKKSVLALGLLASFIVFYACKKDVASTETQATSASPSLPGTTASYFSKTSDWVLNEKATLGRVLFYDKHLSVNNAVSCGSCHKQSLAFADNAAFSNGFENRLTGRNSMAIQNIGNSRSGNDPLDAPGLALFWDGREDNIKNLVNRPITNHVEMGIDDPNVFASKLAELPYYKQLFMKAYDDDAITSERVSECIALFVVSIRSENTRFDKSEPHSQVGGQVILLTAEEQYGKSLFVTKYNCLKCHNLSPAYYTGGNFFDIGLDAVAKDKGRGELGGPGMYGTFVAPNLRNVALTAPYMHDGRFKTLWDVLDHYSKGINASANLSEELKGIDGQPMRMNIAENEKQALVAFLNTLTDNAMITDAKFSDPFVTQ